MIGYIKKKLAFFIIMILSMQFIVPVFASEVLYAEMDSAESEGTAVVQDLSQYIVTIDEETFPDQAFREYLLSVSEENEWKMPGTEQNYIFTPSFNYCLCSYMGIKSLKGIEKLPYIAVLKCSGNQIRSLDVSKLSRLMGLNCMNNELTSLDITQNKMLRAFACTYNAISLLDFRGITEIDPFDQDNFNVAMQKGRLTILCDRGSKMEEFCKAYLYPYAYSYMYPRPAGSLSGNTISLAVKEKMDLKGILLTDQDGAKGLSVSDKSVLSLTKDGTIRGKSQGNAVLSGTITRGGVSYPISLNVTVFDPKFKEKKIKLESFTKDLLISDYIEGAAFGPDSYASSDEDIAEVDPVTGKLTLKKKGTVTVKAFYGTGKNAKKLQLKVKASVPYLSADKLYIKKGKGASLKVKNNKGGVLWRSENDTVVRVDSGGKLMGIGAGTANVDAILYYGTDNETVLKCKVTVLN